MGLLCPMDKKSFSLIRLLAVAGTALAISGCAVYPVDAGYSSGYGYGGGYSTSYDYGYQQPVYSPFSVGIYSSGRSYYGGHQQRRHYGSRGHGGFKGGHRGGRGGHGRGRGGHR